MYKYDETVWNFPECAAAQPHRIGEGRQNFVLFVALPVCTVVVLRGKQSRAEIHKKVNGK